MGFVMKRHSDKNSRTGAEDGPERKRKLIIKAAVRRKRENNKTQRFLNTHIYTYKDD